MNAIARPFGMLLMFLYELVGNYGVAIILFAVIIRVILLPFQMKGKRGTMRVQRLQPKLQELQKKHAANKQKLNEETMKLYKQEGASPTSGCLWNLLPLPIMFALFIAISNPLTIMMGIAPEQLEAGGAIYQMLERLGFVVEGGRQVQIAQAMFINNHYAEFAALGVENLHRINFSFFGGIDLGIQPQWNFLWTTDWGNSSIWGPGFLLFLIPLISGGVQFLHARITQKTNPGGGAMPGMEGQAGSMKTMMMLMPLFSVYIGFITPGALGLYWTMGSVLMILQDLWLTRRYTKILDVEEAARNKDRDEKEAEIEAKRLETERMKAEGKFDSEQNTSKRKKQMTEKQEKLEKAAQWQKRNDPEPDPSEVAEPSRVGHRKHARGRAYDPSRYTNETSEKDEEVEILAVAAEDLANDVEIEYIEDAGDIDVDADEVESAVENSQDIQDDDTQAVEEIESEQPSDDEETPSTTRFETARFDSPKEDE